MKSLKDLIGDFIRISREDKALSREAVVKLSKLSHPTIRSLEYGIGNWSIETLTDVMNAMELTPQDLAQFIKFPVEPKEGLEEARSVERFASVLIIQLEAIWNDRYAKMPVDNVSYVLFAREVQDRFKAALTLNRNIRLSIHQTEFVKQEIAKYLETRKPSYLKAKEERWTETSL